MQDINDVFEEQDESEEFTDDSGVKFVCPNCGKVTRDDVLFLCNTCDSSELIKKEGIFMCPSCLVPGDNFECIKCGSKSVKMIVDNKK